MADFKQYFEYTIRDVTIQSVHDLLDSQSGSFISGFKNAQEFLDYNGGLGILSVVQIPTNLDRIKSRYNEEELKKFDSSLPFNAEGVVIKFGTTVLIPFSVIDRDIISLFGDAISSVDSNAFISNALRNFYTDPKNVRSAVSEKKSLGNYKEMFNHISVWLWSKSLSSGVSGSDIINDDTIIDITPYVGNLTTTVNKNGGAFSFTLDPILTKFNSSTQKWEIDHSSKKDLKDGSYISHERISESESSNKEIKRASYFFHNIIQENDLVFIRFETLESEADRLTNKHSFEVDKSELQFKNFDMIGLIDVQSLGSNFASNDVQINVQGRDLMKLFIEDGVYFYPFDFIEGGIFANANKDEDERLIRYDGQLLSRFQIGYKKISNVLAFIINALGTIKICSDNLFVSYKNNENIPIDSIFKVNGSNDRRTKKFKLSSEQQQKILDNNEANEKEKFEQDIKAIRDSRVDSKLTILKENSSEVDEIKEASAALSTWWIIQSFFKAAGDKLKNDSKNWIGEFEFEKKKIKTGEYPDQLIDKLYKPKIINQSIGNVNNGKIPTTLAINCVQNIMIKNFFNRKERDSYRTDKFEEVPLKGIWQIIKLVIDDSIHDRVLADSSIGNEHGSLINAIRKICQEPFVEFYGDTVGDQYYLTVRKPPFDREGFTSLIDGIVLDEQGIKVKSEPIIVDINDDDIIDENLQYGAEAFSWYHINPMANLAGGQEMAFAFLRAVFFKEYADIFGSRPLDLSTNYIPFIPFLNGGNQRANAYMIQQGIRDLQYMIESNAYLPFIRRGNITINGGNRKIKRGCLVRLVATGEVGFVESVTHNASFSLNSIDRTTTISVDRLMVEKYIGRKIQPFDENELVGDEKAIASLSKNIQAVTIIENQISYFNLINTTIKKDLFTKDLTIEKGIKIISEWAVNVDVFNFFLNANQFADSSIKNISIANRRRRGRV